MNKIQMISLKTRLGLDPSAEHSDASLRARWRSHAEAREPRIGGPSYGYAASGEQKVDGNSSA